MIHESDSMQDYAHGSQQFIFLLAVMVERSHPSSSNSYVENTICLSFDRQCVCVQAYTCLVSLYTFSCWDGPVMF